MLCPGMVVYTFNESIVPRQYKLVYRSKITLFAHILCFVHSRSRPQKFSGVTIFLELLHLTWQYCFRQYYFSEINC